VSESDRADVTTSGSRPEDFPPPPELESPAPADRKPEREGLPPGYRMRADSHYVDQLTSRERRTSEAPSAVDDGLRSETIDRLEARMRRSERVMAQISEGIATIESATALLSTPASSLARRTSLDLIRAEAWRASWLMRANALVDGGPRGRVRLRPVGALLASVRDAFAAECRLAGVDLEVDVSDWNTMVATDEVALATGLGGAVVALLGLIGETGGGVIRLGAVTLAGELRTLDVAQDSMPVPPDVAGSFFDASWTDRPGGWSAALGAAAARAAARLHGGDAVFLTDDRSGCTVRFRFGRAA
jgi:hypothetical protein